MTGKMRMLIILLVVGIMIIGVSVVFLSRGGKSSGELTIGITRLREILSPMPKVNLRK